MRSPSMGGHRGRRRTLSEVEILDAALDLLDEGGAAAASIRGIAARVGVAPNAVYTYFPDKAAVARALVERLIGEVNHDLFADRTQPWRVRVQALAVELRHRLTAHPGAVQLLISGPLTGPNALAVHERVLEILADAGLEPVDAARTSYLLFVYVVGSVALLITDVTDPGPLPPEAERVATQQRAVTEPGTEPGTEPDAEPGTEPDTDRHPRAVAAAATRAGYISTEQYLWGLHRLLDGVTSAVATPSKAHRRPGHQGSRQEVDSA